MIQQASFDVNTDYNSPYTHDDAVVIGRRIRYFRNRAGITQLQLELEIGAASGSISRIENGVTNPNKETLNSIADVLGMNLLEREYAYGKRMYPVTLEDVEKAREAVRELFNKPWVFGYMIDDRYRVWEASDLFIKLSGVPERVYKDNYSRSLIDLSLDEKWGRKFVDPNSYQETIEHLLDLYYSECGYMVDDEIFKNILKVIETVDFAKKHWSEIVKKPRLLFNHHNNRSVKFVFKGVNSEPMKFSMIPFYKDERFIVVEYILK